MAFLEKPYRLEVTDGTVKVDLARTPFGIRDYRPSVAAFKDGGIFQSSPLSDGRRLVSAQTDNITDNIGLTIQTITPDGNIYELQQLMRLLEKAASYWTSRNQLQPVYIIRQARRETNIEYATIMTGKVPQIEFPFGQPFIQPMMGSLSSINVIVEHSHWQSTIPGNEGDCVPTTNGIPLVPELGDYEAKLLDFQPFALWPFDETSGAVAANSVSASLNGTYTSCILDDIKFLDGSPSAFISVGTGVIDIYSAALNTAFDGDEGTAFIWVRTTGGIVWQSGNTHYIIKIATSTSEIFLRKTTTNYQLRLTRTVGANTSNVFYTVNGTTEWFCVAITWSITNNRIRLFWNGAQVGVTGVPSAITWTGSLDSAECIVGCVDNTGATDNLSADVNYCALFDRELTADEIADISNIYDLAPVTSCDPAFIGNQQVRQSFTHIYRYDDSAASYSTNLAYSVDYLLFPTPLGTNDYIIFGVIDGANPMPFSSIIFNLVPGKELTIAWEYWSGAAWSALTVTDNTNQFVNTGFQSVHWVNPSNWATRAENSITTYWVRARITALGASPENPEQDAQAAYSAIVAMAEVNENDVGGDIPALLTSLAENVSDNYSSSSPTLWANRIIYGLRSYDRGSDFSAYINYSDRGNPPGVTVTPVSATFSTDVTTPSGRRGTWTPGGAATGASLGVISFDASLAAQYTGKFHVYMRGRQSGGSAGQFSVKIRVRVNSGVVILDSEYIASTNANDWQLFDFGEVDIVSDLLSDGETLSVVSIAISGTTTAAVSGYLYDFIFIPVDEWAGDFTDIENLGTTFIGRVNSSDFSGTMLRVDSIRTPKRTLRSVLQNSDNSGVTIVPYEIKSNGQAVLQANRRQRIWMLAGRSPSSGTSVNQWQYEPYIVHSTEFFKSQRYLGGRGFR